jgi:hypothetical protein
VPSLPSWSKPPGGSEPLALAGIVRSGQVPLEVLRVAHLAALGRLVEVPDAPHVRADGEVGRGDRYWPPFWT